jgi:trigger factor
MNIERKEIDSVNAIIKLQIEKSDYAEAVDSSLRAYARKANIPGFRPGKVPMAHVKKMFGKAVLADEINKLISDSLYKYIKDNNLNILGEPLPNKEEQQAINFDTQESFEFSFDIALAPDFKVTLDKNVTTPYYEINVDDKMIDNAVKSYTGRFGSYEDAEAATESDVIKGDLVEMRTKTKEKEDGIVVEDAVLCPKYMKADDQKSLFEGAKIGASVSFNPKKAYENESEVASLLKRSKEEVVDVNSDFKFTIKGITRFKEAELNQELFDKAFGEGVVNSEKEFKDKLVAEMKASLAVDSDFKLLTDVKELLVKTLDGVVFPEEFLKRWALETNEKLTAEELEQQFPAMIEDLKWHLIKDQIAKNNNIKIEQEDMMNFAKKATQAQFAQYGMMSIPDDMLDKYAKEMLGNQDSVNRIVDRVMDEKVLAVVKSSVKLDEKKISLDEFNKMFEK